MKEAIIGIICFLIGILVMGLLVGYEPKERKKDVLLNIFEEYFDDEKKVVQSYDPNDPIYRYIPPADKSWTEQFGDNERTRLIHSLSEMRVIMANLSKRLIELEKLKKTEIEKDPNE